jgi:hypothetical protein
VSETEDPRARFRHLPDPVRVEDMVETADVNRPAETQPQPDVDVRVIGLGPGTP